MRVMNDPRRGERGQALFLLLAALLVLAVGAIVAGAIANGFGARADSQRAADLGALAGAKAMRGAYPRLFEPPLIDDQPNPAHLERSAYLALGERAARSAAAANGGKDVAGSFPRADPLGPPRRRAAGGGKDVAVSFPGADPLGPTRIRVAVGDKIAVHGARDVKPRVSAEAELAPPAAAPALGAPGRGEYRGPFAYRQGKPMRPDTAQAFD